MITRFTGTVKSAFVEALLLSVTVTVKLEFTAVAGGVPVRAPAALKLSHEGRPVADQAYPPEPPAAENVWLYAAPIVAAGSGEVVVMVSAAFTGRTKGRVSTPPAPSVTVAVKLTEPAAGGVPVSKPPALIVSHAGRPAADQLKRATPPPSANARL